MQLDYNCILSELLVTVQCMENMETLWLMMFKISIPFLYYTEIRKCNSNLIALFIYISQIIHIWLRSNFKITNEFSFL